MIEIKKDDPLLETEDLTNNGVGLFNSNGGCSSNIKIGFTSLGNVLNDARNSIVATFWSAANVCQPIVDRSNKRGI